MQHLPRRLVTIPAIIIALPILILLAPIVIVVGTVVDLLSGLRQLPIARLWLFAIVFVAHEWIGQTYALYLWLTSGFGRSLNHEKHRAMQGWWAASLLNWARRILNVQIDLDDLDTMPPGDVIVFSRHASMVDALLPAYLFTSKLKRSVHYVIKKELRIVPNIDVFGHRLGNHFVDRAGNRSREVEQIASLANGATPASALVIFPEGTYATPKNKRRIQRSLERRGDERSIAMNRTLRRLLPPKPAGSMALLQQRPQAPIVVRWWTTHREDVPRREDEVFSWIEEQWLQLDSWMHERLQ